MTVVVFGVALLVGGLLVPLVFSAIRQHCRRQRDEDAFWEQVRHRPGLFDWADHPDL